jgi:hypothetical protein
MKKPPPIPVEISDQIIAGAAAFFKTLKDAAENPPTEDEEKSKLVVDLCVASEIVSDGLDQVDTFLSKD